MCIGLWVVGGRGERGGIDATQRRAQHQECLSQLFLHRQPVDRNSSSVVLFAFAQTTQDNSQSAGSSPVTESYEIVKNSAGSPAGDASPTSEMSSPSSFEHINGDQAGQGERELGGGGEKMEEEEEAGGGGGEEVLLDEQGDKAEEDSGMRHRKSGRALED